MKFSSIKEYFYKLYNVCYLATLIPLGAFIYLYLKLQDGNVNAFIQDAQQVLIIQIVAFLFVALILTIVHLVTKKKLKTLSRELSLGNRMDRYFYLALNRIGTGAFTSLMMGGGLMATGSEVFSIFFLAILLWMALQWPTPKKLCVELSLKGDEREMVLYKRESL